ncbi:phosphate ABC transporter ATP-binding protein [Heyndrickxia acidiproducens]|uniref:ABC transporter ATP-binding protein n=1 Tax=Heyndrickxia acidiproducens TaxID=1121084 RepID=UPI000379BF72|nr:phosphate ABC transporter ATP-binding protein [Heyndrickxia acidiproducens]
MIQTNQTSTPEAAFINVRKSFLHNNEKIPVLKGITGEVKTGEILTIIGPSGSGKSTLLSLCNLLITPDEGEVRIRGKEVRAWNIQELRRRVGIAFQSAPMLSGTALENLQLPAKLQGRELDDPEKYMEYVGLPKNLLNRKAKELSGGQRQRLSLARTLVNEPGILLLDEVTSALDSISAHEVEELIVRINRERHTTILWVTHDLAQAERVGEDTWLLIDGKLIEKAPTREFFTSPKTTEAQHFLEMKRGTK